MEGRRRGEATMVCLTELNNGVKKSKLFPAVAEKFQLKIETVRKDVRRARERRRYKVFPPFFDTQSELSCRVVGL